MIDTVHGFAYYVVFAHPMEIVKVRLSDFTRVGTLTLNPNEDYPNSAVIDAANGFAYFGVNDGNLSDPGIIVKVRLSDFTRVDALTLSTGKVIFLPQSSIPLMVSPTSEPRTSGAGIIVKIRLSDLHVLIP